ncbi:hypothetical protein DFH08DRAFT_718602, partial [Mycena albidolilacea]
FLSILYPHDSKTWLTHMEPRDKIKDWVLSSKVTPPPLYLTQDDLNIHKAELLEGGLAGPLCWYKQYTTRVVAEDDKRAPSLFHSLMVPKENYIIKQPVFFAATLNDHICRPEVGLVSLKPGCPNLTIKEYDTDHVRTHPFLLKFSMVADAHGLQLAAPE